VRPDSRARPARAWQAIASLFGGVEPVNGITTREWEEAGAPTRLTDRLAATDPTRRESEFVRLFVNAMPEVPCPPYASVYLEGELYGSVTNRVRDLYRKWGVDTAEVPDHFAVEAAFMAGLLTAAGNHRDAASDLAWLQDHLRRWAPTFLARVQEEDRTGVYAEAARWARTLVTEPGPAPHATDAASSSCAVK
jgi:TorA maturation chaperone TorD